MRVKRVRKNPRLAMSLGLWVLSLPVLAQPAGMPDPRRMSGIARVDSGLEAGAISVRALLGSFAQPAVDTEITLELFDKDRKSLGQQSMQSDAAGRVTFRQLSSRYPGLAFAVAKATLDGVQEASSPIAIDPRAGSRVLLVKGAKAMAESQGGAGAVPANPHGSAAGPAPGSPHGDVGKMGMAAPALCQPNELHTHPPGTLVVGVIEFSPQGQLTGRPDKLVTLKVMAPGKPERLVKAKTDANGRATFKDLVGEDYPEGTRLQVQAPADAENTQLPAQQAGARADGTVPIRKVRLEVFRPDASKLVSQTFVWGKDAKVVLLTRSCVKPERRAVQDAKVTLIRHSMTGDKSRSEHHLDAQGQVLMPIENHHDGDFYSIQAVYQGAPFQTAFFQPPKHAGVAAELPVYEVSSDPSLLRSAVQFEFYSREDNMAQVNRFYQVYVPGHRAFWQPDLKIEGPQDTRWFKVVPSAEAHLKHDEGAPFARLVAPILPGKPVDLSVAFGVPHTGHLDLRWTAPFALERALGVTSDEMRFVRGADAPSKKGQHQGSRQAALSELHLHAPGARLCERKASVCEAGPGKATIDLEVQGFAYEKPWLVWAGSGLAGVSLVGLGMGLWLGRREDPKSALLAQRDELWGRLQRAKEAKDEIRVKDLTAQLNALYHRMESLQSQSSSSQA